MTSRPFGAVFERAQSIANARDGALAFVFSYIGRAELNGHATD